MQIGPNCCNQRAAFGICIRDEGELMGISQGERNVEFIRSKRGEVAKERGDRADRTSDAETNRRVESRTRVDDHFGPELLKRRGVGTRDDYHASDPRCGDNGRDRVHRDRLGESRCALKP